MPEINDPLIRNFTVIRIPVGIGASNGGFVGHRAPLLAYAANSTKYSANASTAPSSPSTFGFVESIR